MTDPASLASRILLSLSLALAASTAACANVIVNGGGSSDGGGGSTSGTPGTSGSGTTMSPQAIAVPYRYIFGSESGSVGPGGSGNTTASTTGSSGGDTDEELFLEVGNEARSCTSPKGSFKCGTWALSIGLQPAFQSPGTFTIHYEDDTVSGAIFEVDASADGSDQDCLSGGGPLSHGTVTIMEIDETHVLFTVQGVDEFTGYYAVDGTYDAPRCGP